MPLTTPSVQSTLTGHPRLFLLQDEEMLISKLLANRGNSWLINAHTYILSLAENTFNTDVIDRSWNGSMLNVAREALKRIFSLSYAYRITGLEKYAERAWLEMNALGKFDDWNPSHYLDVGEASLAMAIGYDWCYNYLTPSRRETISTALYEKSLKNPVSLYGRSTNNWNPVCIGGSLCAAISVYESRPDVCFTIIQDGLNALQKGLDCYGPDGAYPEGYSYWGYGTAFETIILDAFQSAYGIDIGTHKSSGFLRSAKYRIFSNTPAFGCFAFSDAGNEAVVCSTSAWFASFLKDSSYLWETKRMLDNKFMIFAGEDRFLPLLLVRMAKSGLGSIRVPQDNVFVGNGQQPVYIYRQGWSNSNDAYLGIKGGGPTIAPHAQMDAGMFFYENKGVQWATDCGSQSYGSVQSMLNDASQDGQRWKLFRYGCTGHNILQFGSQNQVVSGTSSLAEATLNEGEYGCKIILDQIYSNSTSSVVREVRLDREKNLHITDVINGVITPVTLHWNMVSRSEARIISSNKILLSFSGHEAELTCEIEGASAYAMSATTGYSYDPANTGVVRVGFNIPLEQNKSYIINVIIKTLK